jgi:hypothetical protein
MIPKHKIRWAAFSAASMLSARLFAGVVLPGSVNVDLKYMFTTPTDPNSVGQTNAVTTMTTIPGDANDLYVTTLNGDIYQYNTTTGLNTTPFLNLSSAAINFEYYTGTPPTASSDADGLFGVAFPPSSQFTNPASPEYHKFYTYASETYSAGQTTYQAPEITPNHDDVVREWTVNGNGSVTPYSVATTSGTPTSRFVIGLGNVGHHEGGNPQFGPDGELYFTEGDGQGNGDGYEGSIGSSTDGFTGNISSNGTVIVAPVSNGQDLTDPLGKVFRIDPTVTPTVATQTETISTNGQYNVPTGSGGNAFVGQSSNVPGESGTAIPAVYAYGFRNPWKFTWYNGQMLVTDVGQHTMETLNVVSNGTNAGWPFYEGNTQTDEYSARVADTQKLSPTWTPPTQPAVGLSGQILTEYPTRWTSNGANLQDWTGDGSAMVGGSVYTGTAIPQLTGMYIFGDHQYITGTGAKTLADETYNGPRFFFLNPNGPATATGTVYGPDGSDPNTVGQSATIVNIGVQSYSLNILAELNMPAGQTFDTTGDANSDYLNGFGQDQAGNLYALFNNGDVYEIVPVPEPACAAILIVAVATMMCLRPKRHRI